MWDVEAAPKKAWRKYILDRANSFGMILIISFLLLTSLVLSSVLGLANDWITRYFGLETFVLVQILNFVISFLVVMVLFALMFKVLPDVEISWRSVWMGAFVTALLFNIGKFLLGFYFEISKPTSIFGAAGTIILLMMWVNYSCQLVFFGAEFTKVYAYKMNHNIRPSRHAKWSAAKLLKDAMHKTDSNQSVG
jgi:membrane protein